MKKLLLIIAITACTAGTAMSQSQNTNNRDSYTMKDDKLYQTRKGRNTEVTKPVRLSNGTTISLDGTVTTPDGQTRTIKKGDTFYMDGTWNSDVPHTQKHPNSLNNSTNDWQRDYRDTVINSGVVSDSTSR